ncbi:MAG: hypothetical protein Q9160_000360 [Pyrenula sp. 1 TL-2023]
MSFTAEFTPIALCFETKSVLTMTRSSFESLPLELKKYIIFDITQHDLQSLTLVCKDLSHVAIPELYRDITLDTRGRATSAISSLFNTLFVNPRLAEQVERFALLGPRIESFPIDGLEHVFARATDSLDLSGLQWAAEGTPKSLAKIVILLLSCLPNLQSIEFGINHLHDRGPVEMALDVDSLHLDQPGLKYPLNPKLESIVLAGDLDREGRQLRQHCENREFMRRSPDAVFAERPIRPELVACALTLPMLRTLDILLPASMRTWSWPDGFSSSHTLTTLILRSTICDEATLKNLLRATPRLRSLTYERFYDPCEEGDRLPNPKSLLDALSQVNGTLEELHVSLERYRYPMFDGNHTGGEDEYPGPDEPIGSLRELEKLKTLEIPMEVLFGHSDVYQPISTILPDSLRNLTLRNDFVYFIAFYPWTPNALVKRLSADFEDLSVNDNRLSICHLHLGIHFDGYWWNESFQSDVLHQVKPLCGALDIELTSR